MLANDAAITQDHRFTLEILNYYVHLAVVEEIAHGQPARDLPQLKGWSCLVTCVAKFTIALIHLQQLWSAVSRATSGRRRVDLG